MTLPHDYSIEQDYTVWGEAESGFLPGGTGWYRKSFTLDENQQGSRVYLNFDGVYSDAYVYVNGQYLGEHHYGYTAFSFDITDALVWGGGAENVIAVRTVNQVPSSRWYSGSGIYRDVTLDIVDTVHVKKNGITVTTPDIASGLGTVLVETKVENQGEENAEITVSQKIYDREGTLAAEGSSDPLQTAPGEESGAETRLTVANPDLWSVTDPALYTVETEILKDGEVLDRTETRFGFRYYSFDADSGFSLNGENLKLNGVCMHHDQGAAGSAAYSDAMYRQLSIMKDMGVNAIRTSHNPADQDFIRICDELGLLVIEEAFDTWAYPKNGNTYDYSRYFNSQIAGDNQILGGEEGMTWAEFDVRSMAARDKNAPSVILWSLGNEIQEGLTVTASNYPQIAQNLIDWIEEEDDTRPCTFGDNQIKNNNSIAMEVAQVIHDNGGVVGLNYCSDSQNSSAHSREPEWRLYGAETSSAINSRGVYYTRGQDSSGLQLTSYDDSAVSWGMTAHDSLYNTLTKDYIAGEFVWTGFDYLGEPTPWNGTWTGSVSGQGAVPNSSFFGIVDTAGFEKDTYYLYRSQWNQDSVTLHLVTAWDPDNQMTSGGRTPVVVYSNAPQVKLYRNEELIGTMIRQEHVTEAGHTYYTYTTKSENTGACQAIQSSGADTLYGEFRVAYGEGTLRAEACDASGNVIPAEAGTTSVSTPGSGRGMEVAADRTETTADGQSLTYIEVQLTDGEHPDSTASDAVSFQLEGPGEILGVDNGNPSTTEKFQQSSVLSDSGSARIQAFHGKALAIIRSGEEAGEIRVTVSTESTGSREIVISASEHTEGGQESGITAYTMVRDYSVKEGNAPALLTEAKAVTADGGEIPAAVAWQEITPEMCGTAGDYVISGTLTAGEETLEVSARLHVIPQVISMLNYATATAAGNLPVLPETLEGVRADGSTAGAFSVQWQEVDASQFQNVGDVVSVSGTAAVFGEETLPVTASVRVAQPVQTESSNVAGQYLELTEDCTYTSDNLASITDGIFNDGTNESARWTNYNNRNVSSQASVTFTWATAQLIGSVNLYFFTDSFSAALPEEVTFEMSLDGRTFREVSYTQTEAVSFTEGPVTYTFDQPVNPIALRITLTQQSGRCVGLTEAEIMTYAASLEYQESSALAGILINGQALEGFSGEQLEYSCSVEDPEGIQAEPVQGEHTAVTVLPMRENVIRILVSAENRAALSTYVLHVSKKEVEKSVPEVTFSASQGQNGKIRLTGQFTDFENQEQYYEVTAHGLIYYSSSKLGTKLLTVNTAGRTRVNFGSYQADGSFSYEMKPAYANTRYTVRAFLAYTDQNGQTKYVYSVPQSVSYNTL